MASIEKSRRFSPVRALISCLLAPRAQAWPVLAVQVGATVETVAAMVA
jgi:hypothetical protein